MSPQFQPFSTEPKPVEKLPPFRFESLLQRALASAAKTPFQPTGHTRDLYLDLAEGIVRVAAPWQDEHGAIIDPVLGYEWAQSSPRFVSSAAVLLSHGRIQDLQEKVFLGMDWCCRRLAAGETKSPDFWPRELMTAWFALLKVDVPAERRERWANDIRSIEPEEIYWNVEKPHIKIESLHNWTIYAAAGEGLRQLGGLGPKDKDTIWGAKFWDKYMPYQLAHISEDGMYRDPGDPLTYDMTTRLQIATPLAYGLQSPLRPLYEELLRRGALCQLLYVSPEGYSPFGGRSNAMHLQEAILAALGEMEARRYKDTDPALAGAFKRQARLSGSSIRRWLTMKPHRHLKNGFPPDQLHGCEDYAGYAVYSLFCASCLVLAAEFADETIPEAATPAETGGYVLELKPAFHKIFASCGGTQIEIDTAGDPHYDATGLGRISVTGAPYELVLASPFCAHPNFKIPKDWLPPQSLSITPAWQDETGNWTYLSALSEGLESKLATELETPEEVRFSVTWTKPGATFEVRESYTLRPGRLAYKVAIHVGGQPAKSVRFTVPLLQTDGDSQSTVSHSPGWSQVRYLGSVLEVHYPEKATVTHLPDIANRQGVYQPLQLEQGGAEIEVTFSVG